MRQACAEAQGVAGPDPAGLFGPPDHGQGWPVLDAARRVVPLKPRVQMLNEFEHY